jgi:HEAT repeat protein
MTLWRGILFGCTAAALFAQEFPIIDTAKIEMAVEKALEAQRDVLAHQELFVDSKMAMVFAKEAMAFDHAAFAFQGPLLQGAKGGTPLSEEEQLKMMAIDSIMRSDPERAIPIVEKVLQNQQASIRLRLRALQAFGQSTSPKAREIVLRVAKDASSPELQSRAIQLLGTRDSSQNTQLFGEIYASSTNADIKRQVLRSWASAGAKDQILNVAKSDSNPELREHAIRHLGHMRATSELLALYRAESAVQIREQLLRGLANAEDWQSLLEIAKTEKNEELRSRAIQQVGSIKHPGVTEALVALYGSSSDTATRGAILRALSQQRNAKQLIALARKETDPELKRAALQHLTRMKGDEVTTYLTELLEK